MRTKLTSFIVTVLLFSATSFSNPPGSGWTQVWADEFNGTSLNTSKWGYNPTPEFAADHVVVGNNRLTIKNSYSSSSVARGGWIQSKTLGAVGNNKYGYYEARLRINGPARGQIWPTWWIWGGNWRNGGPAPDATEFDLMEYSGYAAKWFNNHATSSHHYREKKKIDGTSHSTVPYASAQNRNAFDWHDWGLLWTPTEVSFYYDGVKYFSSAQPGDAALENVEMNLIFSSSPHVKNNPVPANLPQPGVALPSLEVDWVKVWRGGGIGTGSGVQIKKRNASSYAIDGNHGGANGQNVYLWTQDPNNVNQKWEEIDRGGGYYSYKKANTNHCLDGGNGGANGQNVYLWSCNGGNQNQHWKKVNMGSGYYRLEKRNAAGFSIDGGNGGANGQNLYLWASNNSNQNQHWSFVNQSRAIKSTSDNSTNNLTLYPNPTSDNLTINGLKDGIYKMKILNIQGRVVKNIQIDATSNTTDLNVSDLASGIYFMKFENNEYIKTLRFIKE